MSRTKSKILSVFLFLTVITFGLVPNELKANGPCCFGDVTAGVDFLYWSPCIGDLHYAVVGEGEFIDVAENVKTKYICTDWEPGVRAYVHADCFWRGFSGGLIYTYYDAEAKSSTKDNLGDSVRLSNSAPDKNDSGSVFGTDASGKVEIEYQTLDAYLSHPLNISCDSCFEFSSFSGIKWLNYCKDRHDKVIEPVGKDDGRSESFKRELEVSGIGPMFGFNTTYTVCDCLKVFGVIETNLIVGWSENKDHLLIKDDAEKEILKDRTFKSDDDCVCFPGWHLMSGISYETCLCDTELSLRLGWEYVQWINAPTFPFYEYNEDGVRSAASEKNLTFQGIFAGVNISF